MRLLALAILLASPSVALAKDEVFKAGDYEIVATDRNIEVRKGKRRTFRGIQAKLSDVKKAIVTLEEGHSIDITTGL